jgi:NAD(P)-dependent dehydrogenase (short-subunit alcohol dehydrogenase family)
MENLQDKVAVITGGASGIGKAVAARAAAEGMKIVVADIEEGPLKEAEADISSTGADVLGVVADVSDAASVRDVRDRALDRFGAVHLVHNNAGIGLGGPIWEVSEQDWRWILGVNLWGVVHGIATFVPLFIEQGEGHVVNTASIAGLTTAPFLGPYNATKQAVVAISETLFKDLQAVGAPVGVSVL